MGAALPDAVLLAAGASSRMGSPKGLVLIEGRPWIVHQASALAEAGCRVVVVLGHSAPDYAARVPELLSQVRVVLNPEPARGPFSSLQCGLAAVETRGAFVLPVDVPAAARAVFEAMVAALGDADGVVPELGGRGGHPVLLSAALAGRLAARPPTSRLDAELAGARVVRLPVDDPRVRLNLNAPADWVNLSIAAESSGRR